MFHHCRVTPSLSPAAWHETSEERDDLLCADDEDRARHAALHLEGLGLEHAGLPLLF